MLHSSWAVALDTGRSALTCSVWVDSACLPANLHVKAKYVPPFGLGDNIQLVTLAYATGHPKGWTWYVDKLAVASFVKLHHCVSLVGMMINIVIDIVVIIIIIIVKFPIFTALTQLCRPPHRHPPSPNQSLSSFPRRRLRCPNSDFSYR